MNFLKDHALKEVIMYKEEMVSLLRKEQNVSFHLNTQMENVMFDSLDLIKTFKLLDCTFIKFGFHNFIFVESAYF